MEWDDEDRQEERPEISPRFNCGCVSGKSCFTSYRRARKQIKLFRRGRATIRRGGGYLVVYRCKICACLHVGNATKRLGDRRGRSKKPKTTDFQADQARQARWKENLRRVGEWLKKGRQCE